MYFYYNKKYKWKKKCFRMDLFDEEMECFEIKYPKKFPIKEFNKETEKLIKENPQGVREKDITDFLSDILFAQDISLDEFAVRLSYWIDSKLIERIMRVKYDYRRVKNSQEIRYQKSL